MLSSRYKSRRPTFKGPQGVGVPISWKEGLENSTTENFDFEAENKVFVLLRISFVLDLISLHYWISWELSRSPTSPDIWRRSVPIVTKKYVIQKPM